MLGNAGFAYIYMVDVRAWYNIKSAGMKGKVLGADPGTSMN